MNSTEPDNTREKLLIKAEQLFAQKGYAAVSVREITAAAESNLSAVNYHFGNKRNLYLAVFKERWAPRANRIQEYFQTHLAEKKHPNITDIIRALATAFLESAMTDAERHRHITLMHRELAHPTKAIGIVVEDVIRPMHQDICERIQPALPEKVSLEALALSIFSVISMILYFSFSQEVVTRVMEQKPSPQFKTRIIDHVVSFAMNGINALAEEEIH